MTLSIPKRRFGIRFSMLSRLWRRIIDQRMAAAGWADISWSPLVHLDEAGDGVSQKELAALVGIDGSSLVRLLDTLEERGHIQRCTAPDDRRIKLVKLTAEGRKALRGLRKHLLAVEKEMLQDLSDEQVSLLLEAFELMHKRMTRMGRSVKPE